MNRMPNLRVDSYKISRKDKTAGVTRTREKRPSFTREKRNLSFSNMTTDLAVSEAATNSGEEPTATSPAPNPEVARKLDRTGQRRTEDGLLVLTVDDMFRYVFYPAAQASAVIARSPRRRARHSLRQTTPDDPDTAQDNVMSFLLKEYPPRKQMPSYAVVKTRLIKQFGEETFAQKKHLVQSLLHSRAQQSPEMSRDDDAESGEDGDTLWYDTQAQRSIAWSIPGQIRKGRVTF